MPCLHPRPRQRSGIVQMEDFGYSYALTLKRGASASWRGCPRCALRASTIASSATGILLPIASRFSRTRHGRCAVAAGKPGNRRAGPPAEIERAKGISMNVSVPTSTRCPRAGRRRCLDLPNGVLPDVLIRQHTHMCADGCGKKPPGPDHQAARFGRTHRDAASQSGAVHTMRQRTAYELPPAFFELCLGKRLKYSGCYYPEGGELRNRQKRRCWNFMASVLNLAMARECWNLAVAGFADAMDGRTLSEREDCRRFQLESATRAYREPVPAAQPLQRACGHPGRQPTRTRCRAIRSLRVGRDVRAMRNTISCSAHRGLVAVGGSYSCTSSRTEL